jgi:TRAP-type C4-dicarboxylate transport system permease small subunit
MLAVQGRPINENEATANAGHRMIAAIAAAADAVGRVNDRCLWVCKHAIIFVVALLAVILCAAVFWRYALNNAIPWSEELSKYLMVWLTFLGAPIALRHGSHINIDLLQQLMPPRGRQLFHLVIHLLVVATMVLVLWYGISFAQLGARQVASSFRLSMLWMYLAVPIGAALVALVALEHSLKSLVGIADPARGLAIDHDLLADETRE